MENFNGKLTKIEDGVWKIALNSYSAVLREVSIIVIDHIDNLLVDLPGNQQKDLKGYIEFLNVVDKVILKNQYILTKKMQEQDITWSGGPLSDYSS